MRLVPHRRAPYIITSRRSYSALPTERRSSIHARTLMDEVFEGRMGGPTIDLAQENAFTAWVGSLPRSRSLRVGHDSHRGRIAPLFWRSAVRDLSRRRDADEQPGDGRRHRPRPPSAASVGISLRLPVMHTGCATALAERFNRACSGSGAPVIRANSRSCSIAISSPTSNRSESHAPHSNTNPMKFSRLGGCLQPPPPPSPNHPHPNLRSVPLSSRSSAGLTTKTRWPANTSSPIFAMRPPS